jgi:hypothetical protein
MVRLTMPMGDADFAAWRAVDHGERELDWSVWLGQPDSADYLTATGRELIPRMVSDLTTFFGPRWLHRAAYPNDKTGRQLVPGLGRFAPTLALSESLRPGSFVEALRWWAALQFLESSHVPGIRPVRKDARKDVTAARLFHTLTQTRLGAIGASLGAAVTLEPPKTGGPGDVLLKVPGTELFIEVVTFSPDRNFAQHDEYTHRHTRYLHFLEGRQPVHFEGDVPGFLHKAERSAGSRRQRGPQPSAPRPATRSNFPPAMTVCSRSSQGQLRSAPGLPDRFSSQTRGADWLR